MDFALKKNQDGLVSKQKKLIFPQKYKDSMLNLYLESMFADFCGF